jgi:hypothetical protein
MAKKAPAKAKNAKKTKASNKPAAPKSAPKAKLAAKAKAPLKAAATKGPPAKVDKRRSQAEAAMEAALKANKKTPAEESEEEEFDPAAFYAASGVSPSQIKSHVMRKERVDLQVNVRYRFLKGPLVYNADLINLSKGGLCLKTQSIIKNKTVLKIEIPLPHTSELFAIQAEVIWSESIGSGKDKSTQTGLRFMPMSLAKQAVINQFIQQRRDEVVMAKIGLDRFTDSVPVAGLD